MLALHITTHTVSNTKQTAVEQSGGAGPTMGGAIVGMRVGIFGTGYAGLVTAVGLAEGGQTVTGIHKEPEIVARLSVRFGEDTAGLPAQSNLNCPPSLEKKQNRRLSSGLGIH